MRAFKHSLTILAPFLLLLHGEVVFLVDAWPHTSQAAVGVTAITFCFCHPFMCDEVHVADEEENRKLVEQQLGYLPPNYVRVSAKAVTSRVPVAIQTYPLHGGARRRQNKAKRSGVNVVGTPFPTLYWLTNPALIRGVNILEHDGYVKLFKERLDASNNRSLHDQFRRCNQAYARLRWSTLSQTDQETLLSRPEMQRQRRMLQDSGISGSDMMKTENHNIKCLHAHYAYFRSTMTMMSSEGDATLSEYYNPVGSWIHEVLLEELSIDRGLLLL